MTRNALSEEEKKIRESGRNWYQNVPEEDRTKIK